MTIRVLMLVLGLMGLTQVASAQNPYAVVRIVNTEVITNYDVSQRVKLFQVFGVQQPDMRAFAIQRLTEDRLKRSTALSLGLTLQDDAVETGLEGFAAQRQMSAGALRSLTERAGVSTEALNDFVSTGVLWRDLVNIRFRSRAQPSEADIENVLNYAASATQESVFIREIAIPFAERGTQGARALAERIIRDVRGGANFASLARQYSRTSTASKGGAVGWTPANGLPPALAGQILALTPGEVTAPIEVPAGIIVIQLADIREIPASENTNITAIYTRLDVPFTGAADAAGIAEAQDTAAKLAGDLDGCSDAETRVDEFGPASGMYGPVAISNLSGDIALTLAGLDADEVGIMPASDAGVSVIVLCRRSATADPEAIDSLQGQIFQQRMNSYANGYLQELLADAIITDK